MPVTREELSKLFGRLEAAELELERRQEGAEKGGLQKKIADLKARIQAAAAKPALAATTTLPSAGGADAAPAAADDGDDSDAEAEAIKKEGEELLARINPYATTIEGTKADANIPDHTYEVTATTGDKLKIEYTKGKASISIPSTDSMTLAQKIQLARNMTYFALKAGAYETDENGNITFIIRSPDIQLRTALEETVKSLGFKFKTPDYSNAARNQAHSAAADQTGLFSPISGVLMMDPVARTAAKIAGIIKELNFNDSRKHQQILKEIKILKQTLASVKEKTNDEILKQLQENSNSLYQDAKMFLDSFIKDNPASTNEKQRSQLHNIINSLVQRNKQLLQDKKQVEIMVREGFLQEFEQGASVYPEEAREEAIERFKKNTITGQVFRSKQTGAQAEILFARKFKNPKDAAGKLDSMATDGVGKANGYQEQMKPEDIQKATADPRAMAKSLTETGKARQAAQPKPSTPPATPA